jgi:hypothetical protein
MNSKGIERKKGRNVGKGQKRNKVNWFYIKIYELIYYFDEETKLIKLS